MLVGQYGLFATDATARASQGRILGIYLGALLRGEADEARAQTHHPGYERYLLDAAGSRGTGRQVSTYSADGAANSTAFANTALLAPQHGPRPGYDHRRINAVFVAYRVQLTDNQGRRRTEHVSVLVGLDNLARGGQVIVSYGDRFLEQFQGPSAREQRAQRRGDGPPDPKRIKREPDEPGPASPGPSRQPRSVSRAPAPGPDASPPNFRDQFIQDGLRPLVDRQRVSQEEAARLLNDLDGQVRANPPNIAPQVIRDTLRELGQGAQNRNDQRWVAIYSWLVLVATGTQGG
jgi:hypothetical protein